jgi:hypothetical protein
MSNVAELPKLRQRPCRALEVARGQVVEDQPCDREMACREFLLDAVLGLQ